MPRWSPVALVLLASHPAHAGSEFTSSTSRRPVPGEPPARLVALPDRGCVDAGSVALAWS